MVLKLRKNSFAWQLVMYLSAAEGLIAAAANFYPKPYGRFFSVPSESGISNALYRLVKSGFIELLEKQGKEYLRLTKTGEMQALMLKARLPKSGKWDGKWRLVVFDIPEEAKAERHRLRRLLLENNFKKLQASVYVSPYAINREAIDCLKETGLIKYIRLGRLDEIDDDKELKKKFGF